MTESEIQKHMPDVVPKQVLPGIYMTTSAKRVVGWTAFGLVLLFILTCGGLAILIEIERHNEEADFEIALQVQPAAFTRFPVVRKFLEVFPDSSFGKFPISQRGRSRDTRYCYLHTEHETLTFVCVLPPFGMGKMGISFFGQPELYKVRTRLAEQSISADRERITIDDLEACRKKKSTPPTAKKKSPHSKRPEPGAYDFPEQFEKGAKDASSMKGAKPLEVDEEVMAQYLKLVAQPYDETKRKILDDPELMGATIKSLLSDDEKVARSSFQLIYDFCTERKLSASEEKFVNPVGLEYFNSAYWRGGEHRHWAEWYRINKPLIKPLPKD